MDKIKLWDEGDESVAVKFLEMAHSSNIEKIGYDPHDNDIHVIFRGGGHYVYHDIPYELYEDFRDAKSKGSFHAKHIKGRFKFTKI